MVNIIGVKEFNSVVDQASFDRKKVPNNHNNQSPIGTQQGDKLHPLAGGRRGGNDDNTPPVAGDSENNNPGRRSQPSPEYILTDYLVLKAPVVAGNEVVFSDATKALLLVIFTTKAFAKKYGKSLWLETFQLSQTANEERPEPVAGLNSLSTILSKARNLYTDNDLDQNLQSASVATIYTEASKVLPLLDQSAASIAVASSQAERVQSLAESIHHDFATYLANLVGASDLFVEYADTQYARKTKELINTDLEHIFRFAESFLIRIGGDYPREENLTLAKIFEAAKESFYGGMIFHSTIDQSILETHIDGYEALFIRLFANMRQNYTRMAESSGKKPIVHATVTLEKEGETEIISAVFEDNLTGFPEELNIPGTNKYEYQRGKGTTIGGIHIGMYEVVEEMKEGYKIDTILENYDITDKNGIVIGTGARHIFRFPVLKRNI